MGIVSRNFNRGECAVCGRQTKPRTDRCWRHEHTPLDDPPVEQATAEPGEKRATRRSAKGA